MIDTDKSKNMKKLIATTTGLIATTLISAQALAVTLNPCPSDATGDMTNFRTLCTKNAGDLGTVIGSIITGILVIAVVVALLFLIWGGFKWITSGGDKTKVQTARDTIIAAIIGLIIAFLAFFIIRVLMSVFGLNSFENLNIQIF